MSTEGGPTPAGQGRTDIALLLPGEVKIKLDQISSA